MKRNLKIYFFAIVLVFSIGHHQTVSADSLNQNARFFVNSTFDYSDRSQINATLYSSSTRAYVYIEDQYYSSLSTSDKAKALNNAGIIASKFDNEIYPKETSFWGHEMIPGVDNDSHITILFEQLQPTAGGYFESTNAYRISQVTTSNQREMITINSVSLLDEPRTTESFISHEFQHLISFNQKEFTRSVNEDTWLNELRSEYSISLVGLNDPYENSSLSRRVVGLLENPSDSITEWQNKSSEYGAVSLFAEYLTEQYGPNILSSSLQSSQIGIASINAYLQQKGYHETFGDVFAGWTAADYLNNQAIDPHFGYTKPELKNIHISPIQNSLYYPFTYTYSYSLKPWQPAWYQFNLNPGIPKDKAIKLDSLASTDFGYLYIDNLGRRQTSGNTFYITNPDGRLTWFTLMPYNKSKTTGFTDNDPVGTFSVNLTFVDTIPTSATVVGTNAPTITTPSGIPDGALIRRTGETNLYVITGPYKRYMSPLAISLYGHLDPAKAYEVSADVFDSFPTSNYIRIVNTNDIYAVWPDNTKHLIKVSFASSGRDPKLIFTINPLEYNIYSLGVPITR